MVGPSLQGVLLRLLAETRCRSWRQGVKEGLGIFLLFVFRGRNSMFVGP